MAGARACRRAGPSITSPVPQGFGVANMADALYAIKTLVYDEKKVTMAEMRDALAANFGEGPMADSDAAAMTGPSPISWPSARGR